MDLIKVYSAETENKWFIQNIYNKHLFRNKITQRGGENFVCICVGGSDVPNSLFWVT